MAELEWIFHISYGNLHHRAASIGSINLRFQGVFR
jgi:hypothetical protein